MILTKTIRLRLLLLWGSLSVLLFSTNTYAQTRRITGMVIEQRTSDPLPGAVVTVKDTKRAIITDASGMFTIEASTGEVLEVAMLGFQKAEVVVGTSNSVKVKLVDTSTELDQVVVVGYGNQLRKDVTGSISSIKGEDLRRTQPTTFEQALQGKVAGVVVQQISGQPGGAVSVQIRGLSSMKGGSPMYVIDGVIVGGTTSPASLGDGTNPMAGINPADIESIDVLKDASATAIYGSQATDGVIVITTKRGKGALPSISYEGYAGYQQLGAKVPVMNLREFATFINERNNKGLGWGFDKRLEFVNPSYLGEGTDWQDALFRNAPQSNHSLSISGNEGRTSYFFSGTHFKQQGIATGSDFKRTSFRLNLDNKTTKWLKIGTSLQVVNMNENISSSSSSVIATALSQTPDIAIVNGDGSWGGAYNPNGWVIPVLNPFAMATINKDQIKRNQVFDNTYAEITFLKDFVLKNEFSVSFSMANRDKFNPTYTFGRIERPINDGSFENAQTLNTVFRNFLTYSHNFKKKYNVNVLAGHEAMLDQNEFSNGYRSNFPSNNTSAGIGAGDPVSAKANQNKGHTAIESYFGRLNLGISDKYLLTANLRGDGSSRFASGGRWVTTYSGAFAWRINNEKFLKSAKFINDLKLRLGYGLTNNQNIPATAYTATLASVANGLTGISQYIKNVGNSEVKWETTKSSNIGLEGNLFNWRMNFGIDLYNRRTDGLLLPLPLPMYSGTTAGWSSGALDAPVVNVGSVNNKGIDLNIGGTPIKTKNFSWNSSATMSHNINKVIKLNTEGASLSGWPISRTVVGRSIGEFYGYEVDGGVYANIDELENHARPAKNGEIIPWGPNGGRIWLGDVKYKDKNGDGIIDENDQDFLGSPRPKFQLGFNNTFTYKSLDLNVFFSSNIGNKVFNRLRVDGEFPGTSFGYFKTLNNYAKIEKIDPSLADVDANKIYDINNPVDRAILENLYVSNPTTRIPGVRNDKTNNNQRTSDTYIEDGSFVKCKMISLGYTLPSRLTEKAHISALRLYLNVSNAFIITKYSGLDPEVSSWNPLEAGVDYGFYPQPRVFTLGTSIKLTK